MLKTLLAALRTSEFWVVLFQAYTEAVNAAVPDEVKLLGWGYVALRVLSKVVKFVFPNPEGTAAGWFRKDAWILVAVALVLPGCVRAQEAVSPFSISERAHVTLNGGGMFLTTGQDWSGASLGGTVLYNLHPQFSVFGGYDHGFPVNDVDEHLDLVRAVGSLRVHPNAFVGFGYAWFREGVDGGLAQLILARQVAPRVAVSGMYAHVFSRAELDDFEYFRVFVNYHLFGKE